MRVKNKQPHPSFVMEVSEDEDEIDYVGQQNDHQPDRQQDSQQDSQQDNQHDNQLQYSFDEQFKQLYELSADPKRKEFLDDLFLFMTKRGTPVNRVPIMAKQVLDLYELYRLVVNHGGLVEVINKKIWREITKGLCLPSSITSAAFTLRTQYMKYLYPYECDRENFSTPEELQQAIDGNRREGRRPSNGQYSDMMESSIEAGGPGSALRDGIICNGSSSNGRSTTGGLSSLGITQPLSLVKNNSGASSSEEDNISIHSLSRNPLHALASGQAEALNLETKRIMNGRQIDLNKDSLNNNQENSSSSFKVNGYCNGDSNNNIKFNNNNNNNSNSQGIKRILSDEERLLINSGMPTVHIKIPNREGRGSIENSLLLSLEINNITYSGILYSKPNNNNNN